MRDTRYLVPLTSQDRLRYRITTDHGQVVDFIVQYETIVHQDFRPVVRYDCAHGFPHRDILDRHGNEISKQSMSPHLTFDQALQEAERDLRAHWQEYQDRFLGRKR